jgi:transcriptional regulator with XRE-family HTH domain
MPKETDEDRRARKVRAGAWLEAERSKRGLTQVALAKDLGLPSQNRISNYENGVYEIEAGIARDIARAFGLSEYEVWRGLEIPLPAELSTRRKAIAWALKVMTDEQAADLWEQIATQLRARVRGARAAADRDRHKRVTRPGSNPPTASSGECSAI